VTTVSRPVEWRLEVLVAATVELLILTLSALAFGAAMGAAKNRAPAAVTRSFFALSGIAFAISAAALAMSR
jgi:hypothetical protein